MFTTNEFELKENLINKDDIEIAGEIWIVPLHKPWSTYLKTELDVDDVSLLVTPDFSRTSVLLLSGEGAYTAERPLTENEMQVLKRVMEEAYV